MKKMSFFAATFVLILCFSIIAGSRLADAMMIPEELEMGRNILRVLRFNPAIPYGILHQNILMETISRFVSMSAS